jgi:dihydroorotase
VRLIREAKSRGLAVSAEVTPHHLLYTEDAVLGYDTHCKVNPPLRSAEDRAALREALMDGTIDCVATDHAPHSSLEKDCEFGAASVGIDGLETAVPALLALVREGVLTPARLIESLTSAPSKLLPDVEAGRLVVGGRADIAVIDPERRWTVEAETLHSKSSNTPMLHREVIGAIALTLVEGRVVHERTA